MKKLTTVALMVSTILSTQAFAGKNDELQLEVYGKAGFTQDQSNDLISAYSKEIGDKTGDYDHIVQDDWTAFRDTRLGLKAGFHFNKMFSVHAEGQLDYEAEEVRFDLKEAYLRAEKNGFNTEFGRMRTPLFMHSEIQDDDFAMNTYKENLFFSTRNTGLETVDGLSLGYEQKFGKGILEINALYGIAEDREDVYFSYVHDKAIDVNYNDFEQIAQLEGIYKTKYGFFRVAQTLLETDDVTTHVTGIGFQQNFNKITFESEAALTTIEQVADTEYDSLDWRALLIYNAYDLKPYVQYASKQKDQEQKKAESLDFGLSYEASKNIALKASYEVIKHDARDFDDEVVSLAIAFKY